MYEYKANVTKITDGDTIRVEVKLGFGATLLIKVRVNGIDTPEIFRPRNEAELQHGREAKKFLEDTILGKTVRIKTYKMSFDRYVADVFVEDKNLAEILKEEGFEKKETY